MLCALIMAGGKGTRFWPLSTEDNPKQFLNLVGNESMIQMTVNRLKSIIPMECIFVVTDQKYEKLVNEHLTELPSENIIIEPVG
ncbi:MAG: sugar phosphate nucleotidyltransferase, partial [Turicibacter sp.]